MKSGSKASIHKWESQRLRQGGGGGHLPCAAKGTAKEPAPATKPLLLPPRPSCHSGLLRGTGRWGAIWAGDQAHGREPLGARACPGQLAFTGKPLNLVIWRGALGSAWPLTLTPHPLSPASAAMGLRLGQATLPSRRHLDLDCPFVCIPGPFINLCTWRRELAQ